MHASLLTLIASLPIPRRDALSTSHLTAPESQEIRTPEQAKQALERKGVSIAAWALANGFNPNLVHEVLAGRKKGIRGQSHNIAVKLGLKAGVVCTDPANALAA